MATQTTPHDVAGFQGKVGLEAQGLNPKGEVHWNLVAPVLIEDAIRRGEGQLADMGPFCSVTTPHTGRSPNDKFLVKEPSSEADVDWGKVNQPFTEAQFETLLADVRAYLDGRDELFVQDLYCGADPSIASRFAMCRRTRGRWRSSATCSFALMRRRCPTFDPNFTVLHAPEFEADPAKPGANEHGDRAESRQANDSHHRYEYAGELKKSMFTVMNYMPKQGVLSCTAPPTSAPAAIVRCSSGCRARARRTLSADASRSLDWRRRARVVAGGCVQLRRRGYAKVINLSAEGGRTFTEHADVRNDPRERRCWIR